MREQDVLYRFMIDTADVRGVIVRLDDAWQEALSRTDYPSEIQTFLGQAMAATIMLTASIKFAGKLTLQVKGDGPLNLLVVQATESGKIRGLANWTAIPPKGPLKAVLGDAQMTISITGAEKGTDYQGIVDITGESLADTLRDYFTRSEQLPTDMWFSVNSNNASGFLLQRLPGSTQDPDGWNRVKQLASTLTEDELSGLPVSNLLHRLYHEEQVRLFDEHQLAFECTCSRQRVADMIKGLGEEETDSILEEQGKIEVTCEFCNARHVFDSVDVAALFNSGSSGSESVTKH